MVFFVAFCVSYDIAQYEIIRRILFHKTQNKTILTIMKSLDVILNHRIEYGITMDNMNHKI